MAISTNSVIHYTERFDFLKGILQDGGFRIKYCLETIDIKAPNPFHVAYPMVSFCDIPLSEIKIHSDTYGSYGIGLTKNWAKKVGLNPVLYVEKHSRLAVHIQNQARRLYELNTSGSSDSNLQDEFFKLMSYCKNYEGRLVKGKINTDSYRFYDEKEWRIVALASDINNTLDFVSGENYLKDKDSYNNKIKECYVRFSQNDISYIIIDNEDEIPDILKVINDCYEDSATSKELKILSTKILTKNQIWNDF